MRVLIVTNPFGGHEVGSRIADEGEIEAILAGEHSHHVVLADHETETGEQPDAREA